MNSAQSLLDLKRVSCNGSFLYDLVEKLNGCAHIKDAQTGKYIYNNYARIASLKLDSTHDLIGLTAGDILAPDSRFYNNLDLNSNLLS